MSEATPLLPDRPQDVYDRFSPSRKRIVIAVVALAAFISREFPVDEVCS